MKKSVAKKWVVALRSGKYQQGRSKLRVGDTYCCLGVLCDISKKGEWEADRIYLDRCLSLPLEVQHWAGMQSENGMHRSTDGHEYNLVDYNDGNPLSKSPAYSFDAIANFIEKHWRHL